MTKLFQEMTRREHVTIVMTTHDVGLMDAGDMVIELENGMQINRSEAPVALENPDAQEAEGSVQDEAEGNMQQQDSAEAETGAQEYAEQPASIYAEALAESEAQPDKSYEEP